MLELRPTCEQCNKKLAPDATDAMICSFECTFCQGCVENTLNNVCPNCGGGFTFRPIRPQTNWKDNNTLERCPAGETIVFKPVDAEQHQQFAASIKDIPAHKR
ncbi:DUF1272 domain-containing protein [Marinicella sp. W31]|uniref:DUF1272 domain-containing protein n=1 Tax=Marinicella sp. W31 TaxID=3023713 RepID=UPI003756D293